MRSNAFGERMVNAEVIRCKAFDSASGVYKEESVISGRCTLVLKCLGINACARSVIDCAESRGASKTQHAILIRIRIDRFIIYPLCIKTSLYTLRLAGGKV